MPFLRAVEFGVDLDTEVFVTWDGFSGLLLRVIIEEESLFWLIRSTLHLPSFNRILLTVHQSSTTLPIAWGSPTSHLPSTYASMSSAYFMMLQPVGMYLLMSAIIDSNHWFIINNSFFSYCINKFLYNQHSRAFRKFKTFEKKVININKRRLIHFI